MDTISESTVIQRELDGTFTVFGGEDIIATCPTPEEAIHWRTIYEAHQREMIQTTINSFYQSRNEANVRMRVLSPPNYAGIYFCCKYYPDGGIVYAQYLQATIDRNYKQLKF